MRELTRGELAKRAHVNPETIRFYERKGFLPKAARGSNGYRLFPANAVERMTFLARAKKLGFSPLGIRDPLSLEADDLHACPQVKYRLATKLLMVQEKEAQLKQLETQILRRSKQASLPFNPRIRPRSLARFSAVCSNPAKQ